MGCALSAQRVAAARRHQMIERSLRQDSLKRQSEEIKLLLVGLPESGKSTILKQLRIACGNGFLEEERRQCKALVHKNIIQSITAIVQAMERLTINFNDPARADDARQLFLWTRSTDEGMMSPELCRAVKRLWEDSGVQECFWRNQEYHLSDSASYYLNDLDRICQADYIPTQDDVLRASQRTPGVTEMRVTIRDCDLKIYGVSGQRPDSQKWIQCFADVTAVVVCVALNDYDLVLGEEMNRLHQSMQLFNHICNSRWLMETPTILLFNKKDLFEEKLKTSPLTICYPEYLGGNTYEEAASYLQCLFEGLNRTPDTEEIITHITSATDTNHMHLVIEAIADYVLYRRRKRSTLRLLCRNVLA